MEKKSAGIEYLCSIILICLTGLIFLFCFRYKEVKMCQIKVRDSIDTAALAAAVVDREELDENGKIKIDGLADTRKRFERVLKNNLQLDEEFKPVDESLFDRIYIKKFFIYQIVDNTYISRSMIEDSYMSFSSRMDYDGTQKTLNGKLIEGVTIYIEAGMYIDGLFNEPQYEKIETCVDIVGTEI